MRSQSKADLRRAIDQRRGPPQEGEGVRSRSEVEIRGMVRQRHGRAVGQAGAERSIGERARVRGDRARCTIGWRTGGRRDVGEFIPGTRWVICTEL